jgi:glycosyltransferase involved in cell wall biosynthesis
MLRVIFVTASLEAAGAERHAVTLMNRLAERGHECHAVYVKDLQGSEIDRVRLRSGTVRCLDAAGYLDVRAVRDFAAHVSRIRPSLVVAANPYALMYSRLALRRSGVRARLVVTYHQMLLQGAKQWLQMLYYRPFFWSADALIFVCENQRRYWLRRGVFSRRNEVIHNGVDTDEFCDRRSVEERARLRSALGFSGADYVIGMPAWLRPEKNHVQMVDAVAALRNMGIRARVLMVGDGEMRGAVETGVGWSQS